MKTKNAHYGYVITTTPGNIDEGTFALSASGIEKGEIGQAFWVDCDHNAPPAVYRSKEEAETAMMTLVPEGSNPLVYAGLSVAPAWDICPTLLANDVAVGMGGFVVPSVR